MISRTQLGVDDEKNYIADNLYADMPLLPFCRKNDDTLESFLLGKKHVKFRLLPNENLASGRW